MKIFLDAGPLSKLVHQQAKQNEPISHWIEKILLRGDEVVVSEISDYEVRRELLLQSFSRSIEKLNEWNAVLTYLPLTTDVMRQAADFWAYCRKKGRPLADNKALDGDVILAAHVKLNNGVVATEDVQDLAVLVDARDWRQFD